MSCTLQIYGIDSYSKYLQSCSKPTKMENVSAAFPIMGQIVLQQHLSLTRF